MCIRDRPYPARFKLFDNFDANGDRLSRPRTLLIDSIQIEKGETIDEAFKKAAEAEIERFRVEKAERDGAEAARTLTDADILREAMNTVGQEGRLGEQIRCVVSVGMLTEGWDAKNVTHILGLRAFSSRLLCEQVMGRALRRLNYTADEDGRFPVEYADIMGIDGLNLAPQDAVVTKPVKPRKTVRVEAVSPDRDGCEIRFPRVDGYRIELSEAVIEADWSKVEPYVLTPEKVGPCEVEMRGIVGAPARLDMNREADRPPGVPEAARRGRPAYRNADPEGEAARPPFPRRFRRMSRRDGKGAAHAHAACRRGRRDHSRRHKCPSCRGRGSADPRRPRPI
jgi:type III restriction enzyme